MTPYQTIWVIINHEGHIIHQTTDRDHLGLMEKYVVQSQEAGDDWKLLEYSLVKVVNCEEQNKEAVS